VDPDASLSGYANSALALSAANALEQVKNAAEEAAVLFVFVMAAVYAPVRPGREEQDRAEGRRGDGGGEAGAARDATRGGGARTGEATEDPAGDAHARRSSLSAGRPTTSV
jgi:hypothetical protein